MGKRGTNQAKSINVAAPAESIGYWRDRLSGAGIAVERGRALRHAAARVRAPVRHPVPAGRSRPARTRASPTAAATSPPSTRSAAPGAPRPRSASPSRWTTSCARRSTRAARLRGRAPPVPHHRRQRPRPDPRARRGARPAAGHVALRRGHDPPPRLRRRHLREPAQGQGLHRRPRLHRRLRRQGPRLLLQRLPAHAGRRAVRARLLDRGGLHDRRARRRARHAHVHPAALGGPPLRDRPAGADRHHRDRPGLAIRTGRGCSVAPWRRYACRPRPSRCSPSSPGRRRRAPSRASSRRAPRSCRSSAKAGEAQVLALGIDTLAYGDASPVARNGTYSLDLPAGKWALRTVGRGAGQAVRRVHLGGDRDQGHRTPLAAADGQEVQEAAQARSVQHVANVNPRDGRELPGRGLRDREVPASPAPTRTSPSWPTACRTC